MTKVNKNYTLGSHDPFILGVGKYTPMFLHFIPDICSNIYPQAESRAIIITIPYFHVSIYCFS